MEMQFRIGPRSVVLSVSEKDGRTLVTIDGREITVDDVAIDERSRDELLSLLPLWAEGAPTTRWR